MSDERVRPLCFMTHRDRQPREATHGFLCDDHAARVNELLQDILEFSCLLDDPEWVLPGSGQSDGSRHTKASEAPAPARLEILALTDKRNYDTGVRSDGDQEWWAAGIPDIPNPAGVLASWVSTVCEERALDGSTTDGTITGSIKFLQAHREWIYTQLWVDEYERELRGLRRVLARAVGHTDPKPVGRCPSMNGDGTECGGPLWPEETAMAVNCTRCQRHYDEPFLRHLGGMLDAG